ncbi:tryptophan synthase subunit alpha [Syntrophomonas palmitatica]|uniref:tryptophan synthase subunit alpha n=1 Tax=Syntrophomonas palmitatica TaxID=402877 RepID=UPI0006D1CC2B|nr:tryptophan synthase subunit alpha [Syntrophomonas palmitatica]
MELGVPFTDPLADGEIIERFHHRGVARGLNLQRGLEFAARAANITAMNLVLFCYFNPIYHMGLDVFGQQAREAGVQGLIVPDVPLDEMAVLRESRLDVIPMVAPSSTPERMKKAGEYEPSFIYCVSVRGVTGVRVLPEQEIKDYLTKVKSCAQTPLALGFGISSPEQVRTFHGYADGIVTGSYLARLLEEYESKPQLLPGVMEKAMAELKKAAVKE